jgi:ribosome-associated protein
MDDPMPIGPHTAIPLSEITVRVSRSSGPGGQHANVTASRVEAIVDLTAAAGLGDEQRRRLIARLGPRVTAQDTRSQLRNRELALTRLQHRLSAALRVTPARRRTKPSKGAVQRRLEAKRRQGERKRARRRPPEGD